VIPVEELWNDFWDELENLPVFILNNRQRQAPFNCGDKTKVDRE
jgi:hypothetical protein